MDMERLDLYSAVHKMQRARLFGLTIEAGRLDPSDREGSVALAAAVGAVVDELVAHADHEETFIHPVLWRVAPAVAGQLEGEHTALNVALDDVRDAAQRCEVGLDTPTVLYRALASFTARYLDHLAVEESTALPALWNGCTDDELAAALASFRESRTDIENLTSVLAQLPTLTPTEATRMLHVGIGNATHAEIAPALATLLDPRTLGLTTAPLTTHHADLQETRQSRLR
jgi:hypothetical protein